MGLDVVELILAVEDAFQIQIADEEAGSVSTIGDLHNLVVSKTTRARFEALLDECCVLSNSAWNRRYAGDGPTGDQACHGA